MAVEALQLHTSNHARLYSGGWIRAGDSVKISKQCLIPLSIGGKYEGKNLCDVVDMNTTHIILGRPWHYDVETL